MNREFPHNNDILLPLDLEKYSMLAETLRKDWPAYAEYYYFVKTAYKWRSKEPNSAHTIYCPKGDYNSGIFVAIPSFGMYSVVTFAHEGFEHLLHKAVTETKIINWTQAVRFDVISSRIISTVLSITETLKQTKGIEVESILRGNVFLRTKEECAAQEVRVPEECYLNRINESHVPLIHSLWPLRNKEAPEITTNVLLRRLRLNGGLGLFSKKNNELLSWIMQGEFGETCVFQTIEKAKRKGYGRVVVDAFAKELAGQGYDRFGFIKGENVASETLARSSHSKEKQPFAYIQMKKLMSRV